MCDSDQPLTEEQKQFVEDHMWIVQRHMCRLAMHRRKPCIRQHEEDLLQEGYIGLIYAVQRYHPECGLTFREWAFPRVSAAVSHAWWKLYPKIPVTRKQFREQEPGPRVSSLEQDQLLNTLSRGKPDTPEGETFRQRIHSICNTALDETIDRVSGAPRSLPDRKKVAEAIASERIMTTDSHQTSIRALSRNSNATKGRLTYLEKQMRDVAELLLSRSRELGFLQSISSRSSDGLDEVIPESVYHSLETITTEQWLHDFRRSTREKRKIMLGELLESAEASQPGIVRELVSRLSAEERTRQDFSMMNIHHPSKAA